MNSEAKNISRESAGHTKVLIYLKDTRLSSIVKTTFRKINDKFGLNIDLVPTLDSEQTQKHLGESRVILVTNKNLFVGFDEKKLKKANSEVFFIESSPQGEDEDFDKEIISYIESKNLFTTLTTLFMDKILPALINDNFVSVQMTRLNAHLSYPNDFYIKITDKKYIKIVSANEILGEDVIDKFYQRHDIFFYVPHGQYNQFVDFQFRRRDLTQQENSHEGEHAGVETVEDLHMYLKEVGFNEAAVETARNSLVETRERFEKVKVLGPLLKRFKDLEGSFLYTHSYFASVLAFVCRKHFDWLNHENLEKIQLGCMFHDLGHANEQSCVYESLSLNEIKNLPADIQLDVLGHTTALQEELEASDLHDDVIKIIIGHHGVNGEDSYPKKVYSAEINHVFALFMLVHEMSTRLLKSNFKDKDIERVLSEVEEKFSSGNFRKILPQFRIAMEKSFLIR